MLKVCCLFKQPACCSSIHLLDACVGLIAEVSSRAINELFSPNTYIGHRLTIQWKGKVNKAKQEVCSKSRNESKRPSLQSYPLNTG